MIDALSQAVTVATTQRARLIGQQDVSMGAVKVTTEQRASIRGHVPFRSATIKTLSVGHLMLLTDEEEHKATRSYLNYWDRFHSLLSHLNVPIISKVTLDIHSKK